MSRLEERDFPSGPVVKTSISNGGDGDLIPGWEAKISHAAWPKNIKQTTIVTNSVKTLKNDPH